MTCKKVWKGFLILLLALVAQAEAAQKTYKVTGTIRALSSEAVWVDTETETLEFSRQHKNVKVPADAKAGDQITVWYTLSPQKVLLEKNSNVNKQQPGQADPSIPGIILDDRAFYDAKNLEKRNESG